MYTLENIVLYITLTVEIDINMHLRINFQNILYDLRDNKMGGIWNLN